MNRCLRKTVCLIVSSLFLALVSPGENESDTSPKLSHADAAVILTKYSGLFRRHIDAGMDMGECVEFLNKNGIYFGLLEVLNGTEFTVKDCARAMGQVDLVLSGEAEYINGKVILPPEIISWEEYCILNDVKYVQGYESMRQVLIKLGRKNG